MLLLVIFAANCHIPVKIHGLKKGKKTHKPAKEIMREKARKSEGKGKRITKRKYAVLLTAKLSHWTLMAGVSVGR